MNAQKQLNLKERYLFQTRDLSWDPSYRTREEIFPYADFEGIKIRDWDQWEDPFRLTMSAYWKYQSEKDKKLYAIIDAFAQNNGHLNLSDARYLNAVKLFFTGVTPLEYQAHLGFSFAGRHLPGVSARIACQMQSLDEIRHAQTQIHTISHYNKYFDGLHEFRHMHDRLWYLSVPKSYFDDARTAGPFEFVTAISFSFEYLLTNLLFVPFMSGAAYNGDMATVTFGFSAQSDEARHMTLGLEVIKFMLEQHADNLPIVQKWVDKWFWRGYRFLTLVAMMMDYMLPKKVMSWAESWEMYFEQAGGALFKDLERYGIRMPKYWEQTIKEKNHVSHQAWSVFYGYTHAAGIHTWDIDDEHMDWLSEKYPDTFDRYYRPRLKYFRDLAHKGKRFYNNGLPQVCQVCQLPIAFTETDDPTLIAYRSAQYNGESFHFCSDGCKDIFEQEPQKFGRAWLPVHQIFQGNCGGASLEEVLKWYKYNLGADNLAYEGSPEERRWNEWMQDKRG